MNSLSFCAGAFRMIRFELARGIPSCYEPNTWSPSYKNALCILSRKPFLLLIDCSAVGRHRDVDLPSSFIHIDEPRPTWILMAFRRDASCLSSGGAARLDSYQSIDPTRAITNSSDLTDNYISALACLQPFMLLLELWLAAGCELSMLWSIFMRG